MRIIRLLAATVFAALPIAAQNAALPPHQQLARDIFRELIEINTTDSVGNNTAAAEAMAARLKAAGLPPDDVRVLGPHPRKGNLVARLRGRAGSGRKPLLLLAHLDVVEAKPEDWSVDPFKFLEREGFFYGRGTSDDKAMAAIWVANLIRFKQENYVPERDIIVALTADEEGGDFNGVDWLLKNHRALIDAELGLNEGGGGQSRMGRPVRNAVQASEKVYQSFRLEATDKGGHSSLPVKENAIYRLTAAVNRLAAFDFPVNLNEVTRAYFQRMSEQEAGQVAADMKAVVGAAPAADAVARLAATPYYNALMRTTCVATQLEAGHAENALPQRARAVVNCRILPNESSDATLQTLVRVVADEQITVTPIKPAKPSPPSPLAPAVIGPIERMTQELWPGVPVIPVMGTGATDSLYLRQAGIPMYGVSGLFGEMNDSRAHGRDERLGVKSFFDGQEFLYRLVKVLSAE